MNNQYDIKKWQETGTKNLFVWQFFLDGNEIPGWKITEKTVKNQFDSGLLTEYYWENNIAKDEAIKIDVYEFASWNNAQEILLNFLQNHMLEKLPQTNTEKKSLGDVSYTGLSKIEQHLLLVRANMLIVLNSIGNHDISVREMARILDEQFYSRPHLSEGKLSPEISNFSVADKKALITEKEVVSLDITAADPLQRPVWYKFFADDGEFFRQNGQIFFVPAKPKSKLTVFATNENGNSSEKTIDIDR